MPIIYNKETGEKIPCDPEQLEAALKGNYQRTPVVTAEGKGEEKVEETKAEVKTAQKPVAKPAVVKSSKPK